MGWGLKQPCPVGALEGSWLKKNSLSTSWGRGSGELDSEGAIQAYSGIFGSLGVHKEGQKTNL
jgi:hypothetical protein